MKLVSKINQYFIKKKCAKEMASYRNTKSGRCFIVGTGPSLTIKDLESIRGETTFASNRIFGLFSKTAWRPTYYAVQDDGVILELKDQFYDISNQVGTMFLAGNEMRKYKSKLKRKKNVKFMYIKNTPTGTRQFDIDVTDGIHNAINVSYTLVELAIFMGFTEIYLIGIDHNYKTIINENGEEVLDGNSKDNYFDGITPLKFEAKVNIGQNSRWEDARTQCFINAKKYADQNGIKIINATRGGKLEVFPRQSLESILEGSDISD